MRPDSSAPILLAFLFLASALDSSADEGFLRLEEGLAEKNAGDIRGLYAEWIARHPDRKDGWFAGMTDARQAAAEENLWQGLQAFCSFSGGVSKKESVSLVPGYEQDAFSCFKGEHLIGRLTYWNRSDGSLAVAWSNSESIRRHEQALNDEIEELRLARLQNGPTGWITTGDGTRHKVRRFGTFKESLVLRFGDIKPDGVREIRFMESGVDVRLRGGGVERIRTGQIYDRSFRGDSFFSQGFDGYDGFPIVLETKDGRLEERRFPFFRDLVRIELDEPGAWSEMPGGPVPWSEIHPETAVDQSGVEQAHEVGDKVCSWHHNAEFRRSAGVAVGGVPIYRSEQGVVSLVAFVEARANQKLQLRVASLQFHRASGQPAEPMESFQMGNVTVRLNSIIWEPARDWRACD